MSTTPTACALCEGDGGLVLWRDHRLRIVLPNEPDWPGLCRVVWNLHVAEVTDLGRDDRRHLLDAVCSTESALRTLLAPDKLNLASLGNLVPHLHWHVIPRWRNDSHFPQPIWGQSQRPSRVGNVPEDLVDALRTTLARELGAVGDASPTL